MKTFLLSLFLFVTLAANAQTEVYFPFPDSNAVWNFHYISYGFPGEMADYSITMAGDTTMNNAVYHKLIVPYFHAVPPDVLPAYKGAIRQEVANKKVFIIPPGEMAEQLLYDFNLQVGDTVRGYIERYGVKDIVQTIDSVMVGNSYRNRWFINPSYNIYFIEGIGSTYGLVEGSPGMTIDAPDFSLICFKQDGHPLYPDTLTNCEIITSIASPSVDILSVKIFPNPGNGNISIETGLDEMLSISMCNVSGKEWFRETMYEKQFMIHGIPPGVHILIITDKQGNTAQHKIVSFGNK